METINVEELAREAKANLMENSEIANSITVHPMIMYGMISVLEMSPMFPVIGLDPMAIEAIRTLCMWYWEMGRLYGRQEIVRETVGD